MISFLKTLSTFIVLHWQVCNRLTAGYVLDHGKIEGKQLSSIWPKLKVPNAYTGQLYQTTIASSYLRSYNIRLLVSQCMFCILYVVVSCTISANQTKFYII